MDLTAATGNNDPNSVWASGLLNDTVNTISTLGDTASGILNALKNNQTPQSTATKAVGVSSWLPWAIGGAVAIIAVLLVWKR